MMRMPAASKWVLCACLPWGLSVDVAHAQDADPPVAVADRHDTANAFLELLEEDERAAALRPFDHDSRHGWSFFPVKRDALRIGDLDAEERAALDAFLDLEAHDGYFKFTHGTYEPSRGPGWGA